MAAVYRAYQPSVERYVAVKVLPRQFASDPTFVARFRREARVVAQLQHPHILPVFDFGESDGYTYFVMPLVSGGTLADRVVKGVPAIEQTRIWIAQVARALAYAHQRGIIHRDVKPSNVLLDDSDNCLLSDFGITHIAEASKSLTTTGAVIGTPMYMAPEQGLGQPVDARTDVYALGIVLFQLVTGRVPYDADTPLATMLKHINDPLPSARGLNPACPESLERVILKALAKRREDRFESAGDMARALEAIASGPVTSGSPPALQTAEAPTSVAVEPMPVTIPLSAGADPLAEATRVLGDSREMKRGEIQPAAAARPRPVWRRVVLPAAIAGALLLAALGSLALAQRPAAAPAEPAVLVGESPTRPPEGTPATQPAPGNPPQETAPPVGGENEVTIWHGLSEGSPDERALLSAVERISHDTSGYTINVVRVDDGALYSSLAAQHKAGRGPDLILDGDDSMFEHVAAGLFSPWDGYTDANPGTLAAWARPAHVLEGKRWGLPVSAQLVAMYYNRERVTAPPATTTALLNAAQSGTRIAFLQNCYAAYGFFSAFDGAFFGPDGSTSAKRDGVTRALVYLRSLKQAAGPSFFVDDSGRYDPAFLAGDLDIYVSGSWAIADFREGLGVKLGVAPLPAAQNAAAPLLDFRAFFLGAHSPNPKAAVDVALRLAGGDFQRHFAEVAGWVPVRTDIGPIDSVMGGFMDAANTAERRPQNLEIGAYWAQFCPIFDAVMDLGADPATSVEAAFNRIREQNGR